MTYTVDEVSDTLGVPRPTLYRYLREYSVPHLRQAGKIYVPEESFDRIKEIRELHREGLDTESVRRRLQEGSNPEVEGLAERMDRILETLEGLQGSPRSAANGTSTTQVLQTILARQSLLISAVSNLTGMVEDLLPPNSRHRKATLDEAIKQEAFFDDLEGYPEMLEDEPAMNGGAIKSPQEPTVPLKPAVPPARRRRGRRFGTLTRRRRRGALVVLLTLLMGGALVVAVLGNSGSFEASQEETSGLSQEEASTGSGEVSAEDSNASTAGSETRDPGGTTREVEEDYGDPIQGQPSYPVQDPTQDVAPAPFYPEQPVQQDIAPGLPYQGQTIPQPQPGGVGTAPRLQ